MLLLIDVKYRNIIEEIYRCDTNQEIKFVDEINRKKCRPYKNSRMY